MSTNYIATVHKPTAVTDAACGPFFHKTHSNLILAKGNILEFWSVLTDPKTHSVRLELDKDFQIFGEIAALKLIKPLSRRTPSKPLLFFITEKHHVAFVEPSCDEVPSERLPGQEHISSDDDDGNEKSIVPEDKQTELPAPTPRRRKRRLSPDSRDKIDISLEKHYNKMRARWYLHRSANRSRSCDEGLCGGRRTEWPKTERQPAVYRGQLCEFSHLRGPFWNRVLSARKAQQTAQATRDRSRYEPVAATSRLRRRLLRLPATLLERLFTLRPLLRQQLDNLSVSEQEESSTECDIEMSPPGSAPEVRTMEGGSIDYDLLMRTAEEQQEAAAEQADELVINVQRQASHAEVSAERPASTSEQTTVPSAAAFPAVEASSVLSDPTSCISSNPPERPAPYAGWAALLPDALRGHQPTPTAQVAPTTEAEPDDPRFILPPLVPANPDDASPDSSPRSSEDEAVLDTQMTSLLERLMEVRYHTEIEDILDEICALLSTVASSQTSSVTALTGEFAQPRRTASADRQELAGQFGRGVVHSSSSTLMMPSFTSCAEAAECVAGNQHLRTRASGKVRDRSGRPCENGVICAISSDHAVIALSLIVGAIKFIAVKATLNNSEGNVEHFNARVEPCRVLDMQFLSVSSNDQRRRALCILFQDVQGESKLCIYDLSLREKFLRRAPRSAENVEVNTVRRRRSSRGAPALGSELNPLASLVYDGSTNHVIPTALGGAMFVGEKSVTFYPRIMMDNGQQAMATGQQTDDLYYLRSELAFQRFHYINSWAPVDNDLKYVLCEQGGHLLLVWLALSGKKQEEAPAVAEGGYTLKVDYIGRVTNASVMVPLPYNHLFLGSRHGDSQLVKLEATSKTRAGRCPFRGVHVISTFYNLAPIVDMCLVPTTRHKYVDSLMDESSGALAFGEENTSEGLMQPTHQRTLVTCSNVGRQGTLRFLRNGLGLEKLFFCKASQVCGAFGLAPFKSNVFLLSYPASSALVSITWPEPQSQQQEDHSVVPAPRRLFAIDAVNEGEYGFDLKNKTHALECNDLATCQVTTREVRLFYTPNGFQKPVDRWLPANGNDISLVTMNVYMGAVVVAVGGNTLFKLQILTTVNTPDLPKIETAGNKQFSNDFLSCLALSYDAEVNALVACGLSLSGSIHVIRFETLETLHVLQAGCDGHGIPRSIALSRLGTTVYLVVGDSTGSLSYADYGLMLAQGEDASWKRIRLSCEPVFIRPMLMSRLLEPSARWSRPTTQSVLFIGGVHPLVMCAPKQGKLCLVNVNAQNIVAVDGWSDQSGDYLLTVCENYEQSPRLGSDRCEWLDRMELSVCRLTGLNQVQVKTLPLYETPRRIVYHPSTDCLAVLVYHSVPDRKAGRGGAAEGGHASLESDFQRCASYQAPKTTQLFDQQAGQPFATNPAGDVMKPASKRKSKDNEDDPLSEDTRRASRQRSSPAEEPQQTNDSAHPVRWDSAADNKMLERWADREEHAVLLIDRSDLRYRASYFLKPDEHGCSIAICSFRKDASSLTGVYNAIQEYLVVGTAVVKSGEIEPTSGRILIFEVNTKNSSGAAPLLLLSENDVDGAVYSLSEIAGFLVATINCRVKLFGFSRAKCYTNGKIPNPALSLLQSHSTNSLALYVKTKLNRCLVGDLLRSLELFELQKRSDSSDAGESDDYELVSVARDHNPNWVTAIEIISPDVFVATENFCNLFVCTSQEHVVQSDGVIMDHRENERDLQRNSIREVSLLHLGQFVNVIRPGSLVSQVSPSCHREVEPATVHVTDAFAGRGLFDRNGLVNALCHVKGSFMLGSTGGWIGQMMCISRRLYIFLWEIQKRLQTCLKSIGRIDHGEWRAFESEMKVEASSGFIDGSLMESLVDMDPVRVMQMLRGVRIENMDIVEVEHLEPLFRLLEEMSRLH